MKIGIITYDFYPAIGGQGVESYNLYMHLKDKLDIFVISSSSNNLDKHLHVAVPNLFIPKHILFSIYINLNLNKIIKKYELDVLQVYGGPGGVILLRKPCIPLIYLANHTYAQQYEYFKKRVYKLLQKFEKKGYAISEKIVSISTTTRDSLIECYGIHSEKIEVIPVGIDTHVFKPVYVKKIPNSVLYVGRLHERKGIFYLIDAIKTVKDEIPDIKLYLIGSGDLKGALQKKIEAEDLFGNTIFIGSVSEEELIKWYNKTEVFVIPSLFEGFGIVCIEAMACGAPVIGTNVPGIVDIIKNNENGILVKPKNYFELADAIQKLLQDDIFRKRLSENGQKTTKSQFEWRIISKRFIEAYKGVVK